MNKILYFLLTFFGGWMGLHKFAQKKIGMGFLYLFTFGLFGIGWVIDIIFAIVKLVQTPKPSNNVITYQEIKK